jgi:DNA end-binding protein Ku
MVMRTKQYLCALRSVNDAIMLNTMLYPDELIPQDDIEGIGPRREPPARELEMAEQLVESLSSPFNPGKYKDEHRERVLDVIRKKAEGEEVVAPPAVEKQAKVVSLVDALKKSLAAAKRGEEPEAQGQLARRRSTAAKTTRARTGNGRKARPPKRKRA